MRTKIKFVGVKTAASGQDSVAAVRPRPSRPVTLRVRRDHGGGLWTLEDQAGQLYLAVRGPRFQPSDKNIAWASQEDLAVLRDLGIGS